MNRKLKEAAIAESQRTGKPVELGQAATLLGFFTDRERADGLEPHLREIQNRKVQNLIAVLLAPFFIALWVLCSISLRHLPQWAFGLASVLALVALGYAWVATANQTWRILDRKF